MQPPFFKTKFKPHYVRNWGLASVSLGLSLSFYSKAAWAVDCLHQADNILRVNSAHCDYTSNAATKAMHLSGNAVVNWLRSPSGAVLFSSDFSQPSYDWATSGLIHTQDSAELNIAGPLNIQSINHTRGGTAIRALGTSQIRVNDDLSLDGGNASQRQLHISNNATVSVKGSLLSAGWSNTHPAPPRIEIDGGRLVIEGRDNRIVNRKSYSLPLAGVPSDMLVQNGQLEIPSGGLYIENRHVGVVNSTLLKLTSQTGNTEIRDALHLSPASSSAIYLNSTTQHRAGELLINDPATMSRVDKGSVEQKALIQLASGELLVGRTNIGIIGQARNANEYAGILVTDHSSDHGIVFASGKYKTAPEAQRESNTAKLLLDRFQMTSVGDAIVVENSPNLNKVIIDNQAGSVLSSSRRNLINTSRFAYKPGRHVDIANQGNLINMNAFRYIFLGGDNDESFTSSGGVLGGEIRMGKGNDRLTLSNTNVSLLLRLDGEEDSLAHSSDNVLTLNQELTAQTSMNAAPAPTILNNWGTINVGTTQAGHLKLAGDVYANRKEAALLGQMNIAAQGTVSLNPKTHNANLFYHVNNQGKIDLSSGSSSPNAVLTLKGNYIGEAGSKLLVKTQWDQPNSQRSDKLVIAGDVSGQTTIEAVGHIQGNVSLTLADRGGAGVTERPRQLDKEEILYREERLEGAHSADRVEVVRTPHPDKATRQTVTLRGTPIEHIHTVLGTASAQTSGLGQTGQPIETRRTEYLEKVDEQHDINGDGVADGILKTFRTHIETLIPGYPVKVTQTTPVTHIKTTVTPIETIETVTTPVDVENITRYDVDITTTKYKTINRWFSTVLEKIDLASPVVTVLGTDHGSESAPSFVGSANLANSAEVAQIAKVGNSYYWKIIATFIDEEKGKETVEEVKTTQETRERSRVVLQENDVSEQRTQSEERQVEQTNELRLDQHTEQKAAVLSAYDTWHDVFIPFAPKANDKINAKPGPRIYAKETAAYLQTQWANREMALALLGKLHDRVGEQQFACGCLAPQSWSRIEYQRREFQGEERFGLKSQGGFVQFGRDLAVRHTPYQRNHSGISAGYYWAHNQFYDKFNSEHGYVVNHKQTSQSKSHVAHLGAYHTAYYANGSYLDFIGQFLWLHNRFLLANERPSQQGYGFAGALETGKLYPLAPNWFIQPQLQLRGQMLRLRPIKDSLRTTDSSPQNALQIRAGMRLTNGHVHLQGDVVQELITPRAKAQIGNTHLEERFARTYLDLGLGGEMALPHSKKWAIYADLKYRIALDKTQPSAEGLPRNQSLSGSIGGKYQW